MHHYGAGEPAASTIGVSVLVTRIALRSVAELTCTVTPHDLRFSGAEVVPTC